MKTKKNTIEKYIKILGNNKKKIMLGLGAIVLAKKIIQKQTDIINFKEQLTKLNFIDPGRIIFNPRIKGRWMGNLGILYIYFFIVNMYKTVHISDKLKLIYMYRDNGETKIALLEHFISSEIVASVIKKEIKKSFIESIRNKQNIQMIPLSYSTSEQNKSNHANVIVINHKTKEIELFEPNGSEIEYFTKNYLDLLKFIFKETGYTVKYFACSKLAIGLQTRDIFCVDFFYNYNAKGFCKAWSVFFMEARAANPEMNIKDLVKNIKRVIGNKHCEFIRAYSNYIETNFTESSVKKYMHDNYKDIDLKDYIIYSPLGNYKI